ncbi:MAG: hypothetical protein AAF633_11140 [Chloroflexota bacterium]
MTDDGGRFQDGLSISPTDHVVEFAPGLSVTALLALANAPASYTGIEANTEAAQSVNRYLVGEQQRCVVGRAEETGLSDASATVVYGEAMLTMQSPNKKAKTIQDEGLSGTLYIAWNILRTPAARKRILAMRKIFHQYQDYLGAVMFVVER